MRVERRTRFEYATCGRGNVSIRKEKVGDSKISGYVLTGHNSNLEAEEKITFIIEAAYAKLFDWKGRIAKC